MTLPAAISQVKTGKLKMLGVLSDKRPTSAPDMPTVNESQSVKGVVVEIWTALAGPPHLPSAVVDRISKAVQAILADKDFTERRAKMGDMAVPFMPPGEFWALPDQRGRSLSRFGHGVEVGVTVQQRLTKRPAWSVILGPSRFVFADQLQRSPA